MEVEVRKSVIDGEETEDIESVVDVYASNKVAHWERDILLVSPPQNQHGGVLHLEQLTDTIAS